MIYNNERLNRVKMFMSYPHDFSKTSITQSLYLVSRQITRIPFPKTDNYFWLKKSNFQKIKFEHCLFGQK